ncbi:hypothetical protein Dvina_24795 [Dactylosporangium vinaceum]|uniref:Uncharacterized protein n=1 Tax=Dactylosporangium vinaceum TaxID=53362 RepID=A0ABV5LXY9_9ACTN|nr:hypothetical protein [Dactylosporangium vinaceum]UAC00984.1 hypothetical protein Dvina_24795 [Dactylosporangium vinaceum]
MTPRLSLNIMLILSVCYGAAVAIVALTTDDLVGTVALIGGIVLGVLWTARSFLLRGAR